MVGVDRSWIPWIVNCHFDTSVIVFNFSYSSIKFDIQAFRQRNWYTGISISNCKKKENMTEIRDSNIK